MEVTSFSTPFDAALQAQQVDDAIARKFDIIAIIAASEQAIVPALTRAKQAGMPVIMLNTPGKPGTEDLYVSFVGEDHVVLGRLTGRVGVARRSRKAGATAARSRSSPVRCRRASGRGV